MLLRFYPPSLLLSTIVLFSNVQVSLSLNERLFVSVNGPLVNTRLDPLVNPGTCSSHVHSVFGNAEFSSEVFKGDVTDTNWQDDTGKVNQTTSNVLPNLSMYWAPSLYIFNPTDLKYYIVPTFTRAYYRIRHNNDRSEINPFPLHLRLLVGNAGRFTEWDRNSTEAGHDDIRWTLRLNNRQWTNSREHGDWKYLREEFTAAELDEELQLEMNINFPNCLEIKRNGQPRTRSGDFRKHASYSDPDNQLVCPPDFPYRIPTLNLEVRYDLKAARKIIGDDAIVNNVDNWYLSTGDTSGAGAHADFIAGWPEDMFQEMLDYCDDGKSGFGGICPLEKYEGAQKVMNAKTVPLMNPMPDEVVDVVDSLPSGACPAFV